MSSNIPPQPDPGILDAPAPESLPFHVVGVAASAGGIEPFVKLLEGLPDDPGFAIIFVLHLDPNHESQVSAILQRVTRMPVTEAVDEAVVEVDHVYTIPPGAIVALRGDRLEVKARSTVRAPHMPADHLFRSLTALGGRAVGVVLSGGGTDGTLGLQEIGGAQGVTFAQDGSAVQASMPRSAIASGAVDFVLSPEGIAQELLRIARNRKADPSLGLEAEPRQGLDQVFQLLRTGTGIDFSQYKVATIRRRIHRRMAIHGTHTLDEYLRRLDDNPMEVQALSQDFLIRVTSFFRDPHLFQALQEQVFPRLLHDRSVDDPIRIWVAACATGEEVYSIAIALLEVFGRTEVPIKIIATDISDIALEKARTGTYIENIEVDVSRERLRRYFTRIDTRYQVSKSVRDMCVFARHNLVRDPPFSRLDLLSCRNVLIYLNLALQKRVMPIFHFALKPTGYLVLGTAETVGTHDALFAITSEKCKIYARRLTVSTQPGIDFDLGVSSAAAVGKGRPSSVPTDLQREADRVVVQKYGPAGVVIDESWNILQFRGQTGAYLEPSPGLASLNLQRMAKHGLLVELRKLFDQARSQNLGARAKQVPVRQGNQLSLVNLEVVPLHAPGNGSRCYLVLFEEADGGEATPAPRLEQPVDVRIVELERELEEMRELLRSTLEGHEATNEELKSAHEEILSSNEELRSINEELQTAKEEMQSANEELNTVNEELHHRNRELGKLNDDLVNLFTGVDIPIVMVGRDLRIRRMTPPAEKVFNLLPVDVGRPMSDIRPNLEIPEFEAVVSEVIRTLAVREIEVQERNGGRWFTLRIQPYVTLDSKIDGASIVAFDIDPLKRSLERVQDLRHAAEAIVDAVGQPLILLDHELRLRRANPAFFRIAGVTAEEAVGQSLFRVGRGEWAVPSLVARLAGGQEEFRELELEITLPAGGERHLVVQGCRVAWESQEAAGPMVLLVFEDVTERRRELERATALAREHEARLHAESASQAKDEFLAMLAHELRNPLAPLTTALLILREGEESRRNWAMTIAERQVRLMARVIDDLLDVSRITGNKIRPKMAVAELTGAVRRVIEALTPAIDDARLQFEVSLPDEHIWLMADIVRIEQVIGNLLGNAVKFTPEGGRIELAVEAGHASVAIRVKDSGDGISESMLPKVFDLFSQAEQGSDRAKGGLGIGLTLVKRLTEMHDGTVSAGSEGLGSGSEFIVRLPTLDVITPTPPSGPDSAESPARRVLVVDDNRDAADSLSFLLGMNGHAVRTAYDGPGAIEAARELLPEVVFLDIGLPGMDGHEVARALRDLAVGDSGSREALPVLVALTGYGQEEDRRLTQEAGFDHHFVKPVDIGVLERLFDELPSPGR